MYKCPTPEETRAALIKLRDLYLAETPQERYERCLKRFREATAQEKTLRSIGRDAEAEAVGECADLWLADLRDADEALQKHLAKTIKEMEGKK